MNRPPHRRIDRMGEKKMLEIEFIRKTKEHMSSVMWHILLFSLRLGERAIIHDASKLKNPEADTFREMTPKLASLTYGSDEYKQSLSEMKSALGHHYLENKHHPEHFSNGLKGMNLIDLIEMFCDWSAATLRHDDGDIIRSIEMNQDRFGYSDDIKQILLNTVDVFKEVRP